MKKLIQYSLISGLALVSFNADAGLLITNAPEIDAGTAMIGFGLMAGIVALIAERRRK